MADEQQTAQDSTVTTTTLPPEVQNLDIEQRMAFEFAQQNAVTEGSEQPAEEATPTGNEQQATPDPKGGEGQQQSSPAEIDETGFLSFASKRFGAEFKSIDEVKAHIAAESASSRPELVRKFEDFFAAKGGNVSVEDFVDAVRISQMDVSKMEDSEVLKTAFSMQEGLKGADLETRFGSHIRTTFGREPDVKGAEKSVESAKAALKEAEESGDDTAPLKDALRRAEAALTVASEDAADRQYKIAQSAKAAREQIAEAQKRLSIPPAEQSLRQREEQAQAVNQWLQGELSKAAEAAKSNGITLGKLHKDDANPFTYTFGSEYDKASQSAQQKVAALVHNPLSLFANKEGQFDPQAAYTFFLKAEMLEANIAPSIADRYAKAAIVNRVNAESNPSLGTNQAVTSIAPVETSQQDATFNAVLEAMRSGSLPMR